MLANTYEIRRGAQQFASVADGMRQKANQVEQLDSHLENQWTGHAADAFHQVTERLKDDIQTASDAFERAYSALDTLANQLDQSNYLYQQAEQISSQIQSLEWSLLGADEQRRAALSGEIAGLIYRKNSLENEAQSIEYQANATASTVFDDIAGMVNRLHFFHGTTGNTAGHSSALDKVRHFFSGIWQSAEQEFEKVRNDLEEDKQELDQFAAENPIIGGQIGFTEGALSACWDTIKASWGTTMMIMGADPQKEIELAKGIFNGVTHPVQTAENLLDDAKVLFSTVGQSFDDDVIHGNSYTANKWLGYASVMVAETLATDGEGGAAYAGRAAEFAKQIPRFAKTMGSKLVKREGESAEILKWNLVDEQPIASYETIDQLLSKTTCSKEELYRYLTVTDANSVDLYLKTGEWPNDAQIPKAPSVLNTDGSINWKEARNGGYTLDQDGNAIKEVYVPKIGEVIDRYGPSNGRYTSPVINGKPFDYEQRALPYVEDVSMYHQYKVIEDFTNIEGYFNKCTNIKLKEEITTYMERYDLSFIDLKVHKGEIANAFGSSGGGIQYELPLPVKMLEGLRILEKIR